MRKIYCISGMGADGRIFRKLSIADAGIVPIPWQPFSKEDTIQSFAKKMSDQIPGDNPAILGLSYGGMLCVEIGKMRPTEKIFLVSSAKTTAELPQYGPLVQHVIRHQLIPNWYFNLGNPFNYLFAGARTMDDFLLLHQMAVATPIGFINRALKSLLYWNNEEYPANVVHIHGTADLIIPRKNVRADHWIQGGSHVLIYNRAAEVSDIIARRLQPSPALSSATYSS